jgi:TolB-like protein
MRREWRRFVPHALLALLMIAAVAWGLGGGEPEAPATPSAALAPPPAAMSLAVQPIRAIGGDASLASVASGLTEELTARLSQVPGFRVTAGANPPVTADSSAAPNLVAAAPAAELVVDGTVRRERDRLRASVRIVSVRTDSTAWAGVYEGSTDSIFAFQSRIAEAASAALRGVRP